MNITELPLWELVKHPGINEGDKNYIDITSDDGDRLEGVFNFTGQNPDDNSIRKITEGKFLLLSD